MCCRSESIKLVFIITQNPHFDYEVAYNLYIHNFSYLSVHCLILCNMFHVTDHFKMSKYKKTKIIS